MYTPITAVDGVSRERHYISIPLIRTIESASDRKDGTRSFIRDTSGTLYGAAETAEELVARVDAPPRAEDWEETAIMGDPLRAHAEQVAARLGLSDEQKWTLTNELRAALVPALASSYPRAADGGAAAQGIERVLKLVDALSVRPKRGR